MNKILIALLLLILLLPNYQAETIGKYLGEEINFETLKIKNKNIEKKRLTEKLSLYLETRTYDKILEEYNIVITKDDITAESKKMVQKQFSKMSVDDKKVFISEAKDIISAISAVEKGMTHNDAWQKFLKKHKHIMKNSLEWLPKRKKMYQLMAQGKLLEAAIADRSLDKYSVYKLKYDRIVDAIYKADPKLSKEIKIISQLTNDDMDTITFQGDNLKKALTEVKSYCELYNIYVAQKEFYQKSPKLKYPLSTSSKFKLDELTNTNNSKTMQNLLSIHYYLMTQLLIKSHAKLTNEYSLTIKTSLNSRSSYAHIPQYVSILKGKKGDASLTPKGDVFFYIKDVRKSSTKLTNIKKGTLMRAVNERVKKIISENLTLEKKYSFLKN